MRANGYAIDYGEPIGKRFYLQNTANLPTKTI